MHHDEYRTQNPGRGQYRPDQGNSPRYGIQPFGDQPGRYPPDRFDTGGESPYRQDRYPRDGGFGNDYETSGRQWPYQQGREERYGGQPNDQYSAGDRPGRASRGGQYPTYEHDNISQQGRYRDYDRQTAQYGGGRSRDTEYRPGGAGYGNQRYVSEGSGYGAGYSGGGQYGTSGGHDSAFAGEGSGRANAWGTTGGYGDRTADGGYGSRRSGGSYGTQGMMEQKSRKGPKGYQRSDDRLREEVINILINQASFDLDDVEVDVSQGVVKLTGSVPDRQARYEAEELADGLWGVKDVTNNLKVGSERSRQYGSDRDSSDEQSNRSGSSATSGVSGGTGKQQQSSSQPSESTYTGSSKSR